LATSADGDVTVIEIPDGKTATISVGGKPRFLNPSKRGDFIAVAGMLERHFSVLSASNHVSRSFRFEVSEDVSSVDFAADGSAIFAVTPSGSIYRCLLKEKELVGVGECDVGECPWPLCIDDSNLLVVGAMKGNAMVVVLWDWSKKKLIRKIECAKD
jgi:hypothetical protein